jgi:putative pantetheine hydrolase
MASPPPTTPTPRPLGGSLTDVRGLSVGHAHRTGDGWLTGTTVVLAPPGGVVAAVDVRGGGPATRETDALVPGTLVPRIEAVVLTGGSAYGLDAASGVVRWLEEQHRGFRVGAQPHEVVPVVPCAALFDLGRGGDFRARPDTGMGYAAAQDAATAPSADGVSPAGSVGAGTGAVAGGLRGGTGEASTTLADGTVVAALVVVNAAGSAVDPATGALLGAALGRPGEFPAVPPPAEHASAVAGLAAASRPTPPLNTTIGVVATSAALTREEARRLAVAAHDGLARAVRPVHTLFDGDALFALATGTSPLPTDGPVASRSDGNQPGAEPAGPFGGAMVRAAAVATVQAAGADVVARAVAHAVLSAESAPGIPAYAELYPSATGPRATS